LPAASMIRPGIVQAAALPRRKARFGLVPPSFID
jgi:hypothetical protein